MNYVLKCNSKEFLCLSSVSQLIQDELLSQEIEAYSASEGDQIPLPLLRLHKFIAQLTPDTVSAETPVPLKVATSLCMRDMCHYARIRGLHVLGCVMDTALSLVRAEQIQEACQVYSLELIWAMLCKNISPALNLSLNFSMLHLTVHLSYLNSPPLPHPPHLPQRQHTQMELYSAVAVYQVNSTQ